MGRPGLGTLSLLIATLMLSGCSLPFTHHGQIAYAPNDGRPTIVCLGDSLTAGDAAPAGQSYPAWLQRQLDARGYRYRVVNAGRSGDRAGDGLARLQSDVLSYHPTIVVVALGSNDPGHTSPSVWRGEIDRIVATLQARGVHVVLAGLNEPGMSAVYEGIAQERHVPLVWLTDGLWSRPGLWGDAHHPSGAGYRVVMQNVWAGLEPYLRRQ